MFVLENPVRDYAWGSRTHIPRLLGQQAGDHPWAEMWMGAHPSAPSRLVDGRTLVEAIDADPVGMLGARVARAFEGRLPFLVKLLAAAEPLSLQVHPTSERARIRFSEQESAGLPADAAERTYPDASHKPELVWALTRFEGMAGFRDPVKTVAILRGLELDWLEEVADRIDGTTTPFQTLRQVVTDLLALEGPELEKRLVDLCDAAERAELRSHSRSAGLRRPSEDPSSVERESTRVYAATVGLIRHYPRDPGVLVTLLLNHVVLAAGEAMYIDAGVIHAYTSGFGVEIMATSDNVLRAGLTPKHVDVPELLEVASFTPTPPPLWAPSRVEVAEGLDLAVLRPPVDEFELVVLHLRGEAVDLDVTPMILLCLAGEVELSSDQGRVVVPRGGSVFVTGSELDVVVSGTGRVAVGRSPR